MKKDEINCSYKFYSIVLGKCVLYCEHCDKKNPIVPEGHQVCDECKGSGHSNKSKGIHFNCKKCRGVGLISWTDNVLRESNETKM